MTPGKAHGPVTELTFTIVPFSLTIAGMAKRVTWIILDVLLLQFFKTKKFLPSNVHIKLFIVVSDRRTQNGSGDQNTGSVHQRIDFSKLFGRMLNQLFSNFLFAQVSNSCDYLKMKCNSENNQNLTFVAPAFSHSCTVAKSFCSSRPESEMEYLCFANSIAAALPMPDEAPVTITTRLFLVDIPSGE